MLLSLALLVAIRQSDLAQPVTYRTVAVSAERLLQELSKATSVPLTTSPQTAGEVLVVSVKGVPLSALMEKIAKATDAEWRAVATGYRLIRPEGTLNRELKEERAEAIKTVGAQLMIAKDYLAKEPRWSADELASLAARARTDIEASAKTDDPESHSNSHAIATHSPTGRFVARILSMLSPTVLADAGPYRELVFAIDPTSMELPLPPAAQGALRTFDREHHEWVEAFERMTLTSAGKPNGEDEKSYNLQQRFDARPFDAPLTRVICRVTVDGDYRARCDILLVDSEGTPTYLHEAFQVLHEDPDYDYKGEVPNRYPQAGILKVSAETRERMDGNKVMSDALRNRLLNPEKYDPLSTLPSDVVLGLAETDNLNLVADLPDDLIRFEEISGDVEAKYRMNLGWLRTLAEERDLRFSVESGWMLAQPQHPAQRRELRTDRAAMGWFLRREASDEDSTADELGAYALKVNENDPYWMMEWTSLEIGIAYRDPMGRTPMQNWRFLGLLSPTQREVLFAGLPLRFSNLTGYQLRYLERLVYSDYGADFILQLDGTQSLLASAEQAEALPDGIPPDGTLFLKIDSEPTLTPMDRMDKFGGRYSANALGSYLGERERVGEYSAALAEFAHVRVGQRQNMGLRFQFTNSCSASMDLSLETHGTKTIAFGELPQGLRDAIEKSRQERVAADKASGARRTSPPPPPSG